MEGTFVLADGVANGGLVPGFVSAPLAGGCIFFTDLRIGAYSPIDRSSGWIMLFPGCRAGVERTPDQQKLGCSARSPGKS